LADSSSSQQHRDAAQQLPPVRVAVLTVSDTRTPADDRSGKLLCDGLAAAGHQLTGYRIAPDEPTVIEPLLRAWVAAPDCDAVILNGGTGISRRDRTYDVVASMLDKTLPGFGEIFRILSWEEVGAAAMLSRAVAGICEGTVIFSLPGSTNAVRLGLEQLILPELAHLVWELNR